MVRAAWRSTRAAAGPAFTRRPPGAALRIAHGTGGALLLLGFIGLHLANHVTGLWSAELHLTVMDTLRGWYRHALVEPALVLLMLVQIATGAVLLRAWMGRATDGYRGLQMATGAFLGLYLICHMNSTFVYARAAQGIETDFWFASGGSGGLLSSLWNVRLIPHYFLAVLALIVHLALGLRVVLLAHPRTTRFVKPLLPLAAIFGTALALAATLPLLRLHLS
jgi:succinate dehydrogenase hydrophobic anchor subunit